MRSTQEDLAWARSGKKPIYGVRWTLNGARIVKTKKRGHELQMVWKKWYQRKGWTVLGSTSTGYIATSPDGMKRHACVFYTYDPETLARIG